MRNTFRFIFIIFVALIIIAAGTAFLERQPLLEWFNVQNNLDQMVLTAAPPQAASLDTSLLKSPRFSILKNNVVSFDFDSICKSLAASKVAAPAGTDEEAATTTPVATGCVLGNNSPIRGK